MLVLVLSMSFSIVSDAAIVTFPVQSEQAIVGTTTGLVGAQTDDGVLETLMEGDTAPDSVASPAAHTVTAGTMVAGTFPVDVVSEDAAYIQYREAAGLSTKVGWFNVGTGGTGSTVPVTGIGFQPKVVNLWWSGRTESMDTTSSASISRGFGVAVSPSDRRSVFSQSLDAQGTTVTDSGHHNAAAIGTINPSDGLINGLADLQSMDPDGFTLVIDDPFAINLRIQYLALGGASLTNAVTGVFTQTGSVGDQDVTVGFQPDAVVLFSPNIGADPPGTNVDSLMMIGAAAGATPVNAMWVGGSNDADSPVTSVSHGLVAAESAVRVSSGIGSITARASITQWLPNGFRLNWVENGGGGIRFHYLALRGGSYLVGNLATRTDSTPIVESGFGFMPRAGLLLSHSASQSAPASLQSNDAWSIGAFTSATERGAQGAFDEDGVSPSETATSVEHDAVYVSISPSDTIDGVMDVSSVDPDGFTAVMVDPDPSARFVWYLAFGGSGAMEVRYDWSGVPAGDSHLLSVKGYRGDEDFHVQVLTPPATWTTRITVNSVANQLFSVGLTGPEFNGGDPQVRFIDSVPQEGSPSDLFLDSVAITSVTVAYSLEVRQNVTGVPPEPNPVLVVKANISAGGENFHIHVWNFASISWDTLIAAPFTATSAYHNASLAPDHLSGGTVRIRFVDAASLDGTRWALSLDFVAVAVTNDAPSLTNAGVSPGSGNLTATFTFYVRYSDAENNAPAFVNLTLDGIPYAMTENSSADTNYVDGKDYFLARVIGVRGTFDFSFSARASSGDLTSATTAVQQVSVLNRAPSIVNGVPSDAVHTARSYVRDFEGTDPDSDTLTWSLSTNASWLSIGPVNGTVWGVAPSTVGGFFVNIILSDGFGGFASNNYTLSVGNLLPVISNPIFSDAVHTAEPYVRDFDGTDPDSDTLTWSLSTNASWLSIGPANGTVWGVAPLTVGGFFVNVTLSDGFGGSVSNGYALSVGNLPPAISNPILSDAVHTARLYVRAFEGADPEGDTLLWSMSTNASWLTIGAANGTVWGVAPSTVVAYYVDIALSDGFGGSASNNYTLSVGNAAPAITNPIGGTLSFRRASIILDFNASDPDNDTLAWSLRTNAGSLSLGGANGTVSGLAPNVPAAYWVEVTVSDGFGGTDRVNFTLSVANRPPQASVIAPGTAVENDTYQGTFSGSDPDGDPLSWALETNATWLVIDPVTQTLSGTASPGFYFVNLTASDGYGGFAYQNITIAVTRAPVRPPPPEPPFDPFVILILDVLAFAILLFLVGAPRRRRTLEQAFLLDTSGTVRFRYDGPGAPFDEVRLKSLLDATEWRWVDAIPAGRHTLHLVHRVGAEWVLVSRSKEAAKVTKAAEPLFASAEKDWRGLASRADGA
jgi:hypothetical protein